MILIGLAFLGVSYKTGIGPTKTLVKSTFTLFRSIIGSFGLTSSQGCDLSGVCEKWVKQGLGLPQTYKDSGVYAKAQECGVPDNICPPGGTRYSLKECLSLCVNIVKCSELSLDEDGVECTNDVLTSLEGLSSGGEGGV